MTWIVQRRLLKKSSVVEYIFSIAKREIVNKQKFFLGQSKYKKSQGISNLHLASRALRGEPQNQWAALCAAHEMVSKKSESQVLVYLYNSARTYFIRNS